MNKIQSLFRKIHRWFTNLKSPTYNKKVFRKGKLVSEFFWPHMDVQKVKGLILEAEKMSGQPIGWQYVDGNTLVTKTIGDVAKVLPLIDAIEDEAFCG